ncbi:MAG: TonB-dependent receptor [Campylobacteraceae bacterium]|jgi:iron complex outermembrane receptor protein|nr:TonB-dependent receptor [Campylobacteraceae bacterium]
MNKKIYISAICALAISASATDLGTIEVAEEINTKVVNDVSGEEVKSADLAEALSKKSPSISLIRRSGIANDIVLRGQKRDNIRVTIDDAVVCGACMNRMDPPTSHVITTNVDSVVIKEGPFDVTEMGTLSGGVKIQTKNPTEEPSGEISATVGSFGYKKAVVSASGGNDKVKLLVTVSKEEGGQYEDGDGNNFYEQLKNKAPSDNQLADAYKDMDAFEKQSMMAKTIVNIDDKSDVELSYTKNESDNVLYPSTSMDAVYDDSNILNFKYTLGDLNKYSKKLEVKAYHSDVDHPMSTIFRNNGLATTMINHLTTDVDGLKILNTFDYESSEITYGLDASKRNWDGHYSKVGALPNAMFKSIDDTDTDNNALFLQYFRTVGKSDLEFGIRYDKTTIDVQKSKITSDSDRRFNSLSANIFATYNVDETTKYFAGIGRSYRVPDARELYVINKTGTSQGTDTLNQTQNNEIDLGVQKDYEDGQIKLKVFYSKLKDYIYFNSLATVANTDNFENIDATIYGAELNADYYVNDQIIFEMAIAYKKGKKDTLPTSNTDTNLADITPLQTTLGLIYDHDDYTNASIELVSSADWNNYDSDNGEQEIDGYNIVNLKGETSLNDQTTLIVGIDNLFDKTYAVSNTYKDLTLLGDVTTSDVMLMNEPGRYIYANLKYSF